MPLGKGMGTTNRRTMPVAGAAYSPFLFWDGRKDSLWAQALGPLESAVEHGGSREQYGRTVAEHYRDEYEHVFGPLPDLGNRDSMTRVFVNIGKSIEAYERRLRFRPSRFDRFVSEWRKTGVMPADILDKEEIAGLRLFVGKAGCAECHSGPLLTNNEFHNTGVPARSALPADRGRAVGRAAVKSDEFNCLSRWSDAARWQCFNLYLLPAPSAETENRFKVPSLRNVAERAPYMHAGQFSTLTEVLEHYNRAPAASPGHSELRPLHLKPGQIRQLEAFLRGLSGGVEEVIPASPVGISDSARHLQ
jgi:cytochrome c peroxidase